MAVKGDTVETRARAWMRQHVGGAGLMGAVHVDDVAAFAREERARALDEAAARVRRGIGILRAKHMGILEVIADGLAAHAAAEREGRS